MWWCEWAAAGHKVRRRVRLRRDDPSSRRPTEDPPSLPSPDFCASVPLTSGHTLWSAHPVATGVALIHLRLDFEALPPMTILLNPALIDRLATQGVSTFLRPGATLPRKTVLEPPLSLKWMSVSHSLEMGAFSYAVSGFYFACRIGRYCSFGEDVQIGRHGHPMHWFSTSPFFYQDYKGVLDRSLPEGVQMAPDDFQRNSPPVIAKPTVIGNDVWIGHGAFILPGVKIGDGACIAARSVVTKDVPPYAIVAGSPAVVKRFRFPEKRLERLRLSRWWDYAPWDLKGAPVDQFPAFFDFLAKIRSEGVKPYRTEKIRLSDWAD